MLNEQSENMNYVIRKYELCNPKIWIMQSENMNYAIRKYYLCNPKIWIMQSENMNYAIPVVKKIY